MKLLDNNRFCNHCGYYGVPIKDEAIYRKGLIFDVIKADYCKVCMALLWFNMKPIDNVEEII